MFSMCKSTKAVQVTGKMLHIQGVWKRYCNQLHNYLQIFIYELNASLHLNVTSIKSLSIHFFYIMYNPVVVIGTNYFVLWNYFHITV